MARRDTARRLRAALLLLWVPGCLSLSGPPIVRGTVGGSVSVQCRYEEEFRGNNKYWCESPCPRLVKSKIVETTESEREVRRGRVSIRDHPANLTFTVTMERLTEGDEGTYWCGIDVSWPQRVLDPNFEVDVIVSPAITAKTSTTATTATTATTTTTTTAQIMTVSTVETTLKATHGRNSQDDPPPRHGLSVLLSLLVLLLFLLAGALLLAWRMVRRRRRIKADKNPEPPQNPSEAAQQNEPCYASLELQTQALLEEPVRPEQVEVEYSTVKAPQEDLQYATVVFNSRNQDSKDNRAPSQRPPQLEPEYSVIKKTEV